MNAPFLSLMKYGPLSSGNITQHRACSYNIMREHGMALIMSLVILIILTLLGITAMGTASLEEKMSGNTQEGTRALEVAESGLQSSLSDPTQLDLNNAPPVKYSINGRVTEVTTTYLQVTDPPRGSGYDTNFSAHHFQQTSKVNTQVDSANIGLNTTITRGIVQIANKPN